MSAAATGPGHGEHSEELAVGWALHALEPGDAETFGAHLAGCARCRQVVAETTDVMGDLAAAVPAAEPPPALAERLRVEVARTPQDAPAAPATDVPAPDVPAPDLPSAAPAAPVALPVPRRRRTAVLLAAAVAAVVGLGGWAAVLVGDRDEARRTAAAEASVVDELLRPGPATVVPVADPDGRTVATLLARDDGVQVVNRALPANDRETETYVLWGLDQGTPKALGAFDVTGSGRQLRTLAVEDADGFPGYGISIEPGRRAPEAPTDVVARGSLPG
ncbi:anti-sigma factor [Blastococcus sp. TML/M2B]|uniref:anti-sigma factor n=1 Tax=unclassified Blastococcus TaxID=2619396 RepID=UPI00190BACAB|nr:MULTISPECIES: anti-sigma factor [unclassified Blastococcus]MBN1092924.1 anti-sigma factor [Blastococcus sp. TML/M2B]MBN1096971.1 anti-sigma factor [Blastococcus sp. TML/C7B]